MGIDLRGPGRSGFFSFTLSSWGAILDLARQHGWEPAGTLAPYDFPNADWYKERGEPIPPIGGWDGGYFTSDYQEVSEEDTRNLANALERALPDIPRHDAISHKQQIQAMGPNWAKGIVGTLKDRGGIAGVMVFTPGGEPLEITEDGKLVSPLEWFSGAGGRRRVEEFIEYCRVGKFYIG